MAKGEYKLKDIDISDIIEKLSGGTTLLEVARTYGVMSSSISKKIERAKQAPIKIALEIVRRYKLITPPIDIEYVVKQDGYNLSYLGLPETISGFIENSKSSKKTIIVNKNHPENRRRFTIAHEYGHFVLKHRFATAIEGRQVDKNVLFRAKDISEMQAWEETAANKFAAELLIPTVLLEKNIQNLPNLTFDNVAELAVLYKVSSIAMSFKLQNIGYRL